MGLTQKEGLDSIDSNTRSRSALAKLSVAALGAGELGRYIIISW